MTDIQITEEQIVETPAPKASRKKVEIVEQEPVAAIEPVQVPAIEPTNPIIRMAIEQAAFRLARETAK